jgi:hypothetical protein
LGWEGLGAHFNFPAATFGFVYLFTRTGLGVKFEVSFAFTLANWFGIVLLAAAECEIPKLAFFANHDVIAAHIYRL